MSDQVSRPDVEDFLGAQREIIELTTLDLLRRYQDVPVRSSLTFGAGQPAEQTVIGNDEHPFYGVTILNDTPKTIFVDFQTGQAQGSPLFCPPFSGLTWPARYVQLSLAVGAFDAAGAAGTVTVLRLQSPPQQSLVFPYLKDPSERTTGILESFSGPLLPYTPPAGRAWKIISFNHEYVASAAVANREEFLFVTSPTGVSSFFVPSGQAIKAGEIWTFSYFFGAGGAPTFGGENKFVGVFAPELVLRPGWSLHGSALNEQAGDEERGANLIYESFPVA